MGLSNRPRLPTKAGGHFPWDSEGGNLYPPRPLISTNTTCSRRVHSTAKIAQIGLTPSQLNQLEKQTQHLSRKGVRPDGTDLCGNHGRV
jgi:hypothetical protein